MEPESVAETDFHRMQGPCPTHAWYNVDASGVAHSPQGTDATGYISYCANGYDFLSLSAAHRPAFEAKDPFSGIGLENTRAMQSHTSYSDHYTIEGDVVIHSVELALCPTGSAVSSDEKQRSPATAASR